MDNEEIARAFKRARRQESSLETSGLPPLQASYSKAIYGHLRSIYIYIYNCISVYIYISIHFSIHKYNSDFVFICMFISITVYVCVSVYVYNCE